jgi:conjugal transfer pilus assembly protein TraF
MLAGVTQRNALAADDVEAAQQANELTAQRYWADRERGWFWYQLPPEQRKQAKPPPPIAVAPQPEPARPAELTEFEALQKRVEEFRNIAIIRPTEDNIRNYLTIQAEVIDKASAFADVTRPRDLGQS